MDKVYIAIDLKSFYASCECVERDADPLDTNRYEQDGKNDMSCCISASEKLWHIRQSKAVRGHTACGGDKQRACAEVSAWTAYGQELSSVGT